MNIFIAGCGRSGTNLVRDLMACFKDTFVLAEGPYGESPVSRFHSLSREESNLVIKRTGETWKTLASLPENVGLIYCLRHPFDVLTSSHPATRHLREFHISPQRWESEYLALKALRIAQPNRPIFFLKYERLIHDADAMQRELEERFQLVSKYRFSEDPFGNKPHTDSFEKWRNQPEFGAYFEGFSESFRIVLHDFCEEFGYSLPEGYVPNEERQSQLRAMTKFAFSVIVPLEFHRGQIEECLRGWINQQGFDQKGFEILATGCRASLDKRAIDAIQSMLRPQDRLLFHDEPHDMALCAYAASQAQGQSLIFTESHCLPDPNLLALADQKLKSHPEWAGFSGGSVRVTRNILSDVEADMYETDIRFGLVESSWRKVLDQIFVVRTEKYKNSGGFLPELGHFAEWHLSARMHQMDLLIEYVPEVKIHHYYVGSHPELIEFTKDFTQGEMKYQKEYRADPAFSYFAEIHEWMERHAWIGGIARHALFLAGQARTASRSHNQKDGKRLNHFWLRWFVRANFGINLVVAWRSLYFKLVLAGLSLGFIFRLGKNFIRKTFIHSIEATIQLERIKIVQRWLKESRGGKLPVFQQRMEWRPETHAPDFVAIGFHPLEEWKGRRFRWTEPVALIEIPLSPGRYAFTLEWIPITDIKNLIVYLNERPIQFEEQGCVAKGTFTVEGATPVRFSWTCAPWEEAKETRLLGLPLTAISWRKI
ncbi:MAG: hypothetical protein HY867_03400 [Chloroflexi bacterium]|nr:hypothetical protein [Chloroflexota bacterium]